MDARKDESSQQGLCSKPMKPTRIVLNDCSSQQADGYTREYFDTLRPCLRYELRGAGDSYTDKWFPFLEIVSLPTLNHFLKAVTGHRLHLCLIFNMGAVKCFHWAASSWLPVLAVVRATIDISQLLGNNDKHGSVDMHRIPYYIKQFICMRSGVPEKESSQQVHALNHWSQQTRIFLNVCSASKADGDKREEFGTDIW